MNSTLRVLLLSLFACGAQSFVSHSPAFARSKHSSFALQAGMASPEVVTKTTVKQDVATRQKIEQKKKIKAHDPISRREEEFEDPPMFNLLLLGDDEYDKEHVVKSMCNILDGVDEDQAAKVFQQAQSTGQAMCGQYPLEQAELFKEQLLRSDPMIFADVAES